MEKQPAHETEALGQQFAPPRSRAGYSVKPAKATMSRKEHGDLRREARREQNRDW